MSNTITQVLEVDDSQVQAVMQALQEKIDGVVAGWKEHRREIMQGLSVVNQFISITARIAAKSGDEVGKSMLRILQSLMSVVGSTVSTMVAVSTAYAMTGILAPIAAALAAFTLGFSIAQTMVITSAEAQLLADMESINSRLSLVEAQAAYRAQMGGF